MEKLRFVRIGLSFAAMVMLGATHCYAADLIRVGKASATTFAFAPIELGAAKGIWAKYGLEVQSIGFGGDARLLALGGLGGLLGIAEGACHFGAVVLGQERVQPFGREPEAGGLRALAD